MVDRFKTTDRHFQKEEEEDFSEMSNAEEDEKITLPHHVQQELCTSRLPYRQGRKLTAVKVYTVTNESNHLLAFNVPSLNLRQETKLLFSKYGKLKTFHISPKHPSEQFTETYHVVYEEIKSARIAKRMLDTKNFYGSSLHICYAPELETVDETRIKLLRRQLDVTYRIQKLNKEENTKEVKKKAEETIVEHTIEHNKTVKLDMGEINTISIGKQIRDVVFNKKRKLKDNVVIEKKFKPCFVDKSLNNIGITINNTEGSVNGSNNIENNKNEVNNVKEITDDTEIEIVDCTSVDKETVSNINEALNYNKFGNEIIRKVPQKPVNRIIFNIGNKNNK